MFDEYFKSLSRVQVISVDIFWVFKSVLEVCFECVLKVFQASFSVFSGLF